MTVEDQTDEPSDVQPRCFFDIEIGGISAGRIVFELFANKCPKTCDNFRQLCTGEAGVGKNSGKNLHYKGCVFHRVIKDFMIQGGDFTNFNGTGGESIYGGQFEDENLDLKHDEPFLLSMANRGPNTNSSQFFILTQAAPHLNGLHVVFGRVVSGQAIIKQIEGLPVDRKSRPLSDVRIANCGELVLLRRKKEKKPKKEKRAKEDEASEKESEGKSSGELTESEEEDDSKTKKRKKSKRSEENEDDKEVLHPLVALKNIDPEEIPEVPSNKFLFRGKVKEDADDSGGKKSRRSRSRSRSRDKNRRDDSSRYGRPMLDHTGRKVKGRGRVCYPRFSRSRSKTPPHWKAEARKTISMREYEERERRKREREEELKRRQEERRKRHEEINDKQRQVQVRSEPSNNKRTFSERGKPKEDSEDEDADEKHEKSEPLTHDTEATDTNTSTKIVEELASQLQSSRDGIVYYQHLYKTSTETANAAPPIPTEKKDVPVAENVEKDEEEDVTPGPPGDEDVHEELQMRRELLKKRFKDWEESSDDGNHSQTKELEKPHDRDAEARDPDPTDAVVPEVTKPSERPVCDPSKPEPNISLDTKKPDTKERKRRSSSSSSSDSRSKSRSRSRSRNRSSGRRRNSSRDRRRRNSSRDRNSRDRHRSYRSRRDSPKDRRRDRDRERYRSDRRRRSRSRSRSRDRRRR